MTAHLTLRKDKLKHYRKLVNLTVDQKFAEALGVNPATVSRVLKGTSEPGPRFIAGLVDVFGVELFADLFTITHDIPEETAA